jgi:cytochrome b6-f complex iron-sulfur subunit
VPTGPTATRRQVLAAGAAVGAAAALVGCSSSSGTSSSTPAASTSEGSSSLVKLADVPVGGATSATYEGKPAVVSQPTAGTVVAFSAICTHMGCTVAPAGKEFHCPCHGSVYDAFSGKVLSGPAPAALASIAVKVDGGEVVAT